MNRKTIIASLSNIANELDNSGLYNEANELTNVMLRVSQTESQMDENEIVYKVLSKMFGKDYNQDKDIKYKIRDNNMEIRSELDRLSEEFGLNPGLAQKRLTRFVNNSDWHFEANNPPMFGNKGGASVFDSIQKRNDRPIDKTPGQMGLESLAFKWISENGNKGAEIAIQKAKADSKATGYPSKVLLKQIIDLLQPRVDKYYKQLKDREGTAADYFKSSLPKPLRDPGFDSRPIP